MKRSLALFLAVLMTVSFCCTGIYATDTTETGTSTVTADLTISTADGLKAFADEVNGGNSYKGKTVVLANDIDLKYSAVVIGTKANPFMGTFDGQGYIVSNLSIYEDGSDSDYFADTDDCVGLFGVINSPAVVKNVTVDNPYIVGSSYVGGIVGMAYTGTIENCHVTGEIDIEGFYMVGGITGHGYAKIYDCSVIGEEGRDDNYVGATYKEANLEGDNVGGIVGHNAETNIISGCTVKNITVSGTRKVGGIVGITAQNGTVTDCKVENVTVETTATAEYAADNAKTMSIGGIVGQYQVAGSNNGTISDCSISGLTFANENNVPVSAGAVSGGLRGSADATVAPADTMTVSGITVNDVTGATVTYQAPVIVEVATFDELVAALANGGSILLTADITTTAALVTSGVTAVIDLNGKTLKIGAGDNKFNDATDLTIKNGNINIDGTVAKGNAIFCLDEYEETLVTTLTLTDVNLTGKDYSSAYGVFYIGDSSVLNVNGGEWTLTNDTHSAGGVFKADDAAATLNIADAKMTLHNVRRVVTYADTTIDSSIITITGDADGVNAEMEHGFNRSPLAITDSTITMENLVGRGITAQCGAVTVSENSTVTIKNAKEATIDVRSGQTVTVDNTSTVSVDAAPTVSSGSIVGNVKLPPNGSVSFAYTKEVDGYVRIWGEGGGNASESYSLKLYSGDTLVATTTLNNVGGIIDGDVYVTWNFFYPSSNDEYWTTIWEAGHPNSAAQPDKVVLYIDGVAVAENGAKMCAPDDLSPVVWEELGGVKYIVTGLKGAGTAEDPYLINNVDELIWFGNKVDEQASDGSTQFAGQYFKLTADIDLAGINWNPIGSMSGDKGAFKGVFDGDGHTISNLYVEQAGNGLGLFARTAGNAEIKNLTLNNVTVKSTDNSNYVGAVVGNSYASTKISNVHVTGTIDISGRGYIGGISGHGYVVMDNVSVIGEGTISSTFWCAGGILGYGGEGTTNITNATVEGITITSAAGGLGAIVGMAEDNNGTQPISGSNLSAKNVTIKTYTGAYGDAYANYALGYLYGGNPTSELTGTLSVENVTIETSSGETPEVNDAVASVDGAIYFDLQDAIDAANSKTVVLLRDVVVTDTVKIPAGTTVTLDLNGKTVSQTKEQTAGYQMILNDGALTINDSVGGGKISYTDSGNGGNYISDTIYNRGTLVINGGTIENLSGETVASNGFPHAVDTYSGLRDTSVTINGGTIYCKEYSAIRMFCVSATYKADLVINGGTIKGAVDMQNGTKNAANGTLTINGGTFETTANVNNIRFANWNGGATEYGITAAITGGNFNGGITTAYVPAAANWNSKIISGGTFAEDPSEYCVLGYVPTANSEGKFVVTQDTTKLYITNLDELKAFRDSVNAGNTYKGVTVYLMADIDLGGTEWTPIGTSTNKFQGIFDGQDHTVSNLVITGTKSNVGFFGYTTDGEVKNLTINNALVSGRLNVGVVAGTPYTSKFTNVTVTGHVEVNGMAYVGGIGGKNAYADWTDITVDVDDTSYVKATSTENGIAYRTYVGGVIGFMGEGGHTFKNITSNIDVIGDVCDIGGITGIIHYGNNYINITCSGDVTNTNSDAVDVLEVGGIAGTWHNGGTAVTIEGLTYTGTVSAPNADGVVFANGGLIGAAYSASGAGKIDGDVAAVNGKTYATLAEALAAAKDGDTVTLLTDVELSESLVINIEGKIVIDGNGNTISQADTYTDTQNALIMLGSTAYVDNDAATHNYTIKNVVFDGITNWSVIRAQGVTLTMDGCTVKNCNQTNGQALLRLDYTEATIKNTAITENNALMAITHNFNGNTSATKLLIDDCEISNNTFNKTAAVYYVCGGGCTITKSDFVENTVNCNNNGAVIYLGFQEDCAVTGNLFKDNKVTDSSTSTRVAGAIFFGYEAEISGNAFVNNSAANANGDVLGQVCTSTYYECDIDLSGNYWNGVAPVIGKDITIQHQSGDATFALNDYYTGYSLDENGNVVLDGKTANTYVAQIEGSTVKYLTIADALAAAKAGDTVTILAGNYTTTLNVNKDITVVGETDAEGNNLVNISGKLNITADGATVKNLNVNNGSSSAGYINAKDVLVEGCTVVGSNGFRSCYTTGTVTFKDSTITGSTYGIHFDGSAGGNIVIDNCVITGWTSFARTITKVTMTDTTFAEGNYNYVRFYQDAEISGCTFNEKMGVDIAITDAELTVTDSTLVNGDVEDLFDGKDIVDSTITVDGKQLVRVAKIGDTYYATLAEAFAAVKEGETIQLLAGEISEGTVKMPASLKNVTIKGADDVVIKDTTIMAHDGNSISYEGLTFDGITFENSRISITGWRNGGASVKDLKVVNCTFKNLNDTTNSAPVHINMDADEAVNGFTFSGNTVDGATGGSKSGVYAQVTGEVIFTNNTINNVSFRPYVIQVTTDDGIADNFTVTGNTFSGSAVGRAQGLGNNNAGTDAVNLVVSGNIFKDITDAQQICYWNFNPETTTADLSRNYYDIDIMANPNRIYYNSAAQNVADLVEMGIFPFYADEAMTTLVEAPAIMVTYADGTVEYFDDMSKAVPYTTNCPRLEGATVTLLKDIDAAGIRMMENDMVLDLNGHTFNITAGTGSQGTNTSGFQIRPEVTTTATIKNGTITVAEGAPVVWMFNVYASNFVVEDVTVDCANMAYSYGESCYVHVSRSGDNTVFTGSTKIINFNSAVAGNAINVGGTMTAGENAIIPGTFELDAGATLTAPEGLDVVTVEGYKVVYENGTYTTKAIVYIAQIGETKYESLTEAFDAAQAGDTVTILAGSYTANLNVNKAITVVGETDAEGNNLVNFSGKLSITADGAAVKNLNVNNGSDTAGSISAKDVLVEGCTVVGGNGFRYCYTSGTVTFKDSTITGSVYGIHFDGSAGGNIVIDNCVITGWTSFARTITKVTISDTKFEDGNYDKLRFYQDATLNNVTFPESMSIDFGKNEVTANFTGCSVEGGAELTDVIYLPDIVDMGVKVYENGELIVIVATVTDAEGNLECYMTLDEAFAAAQNGDVVKILVAGTYTLSTSGKDITVTGAVDGVVFDNIGAKNMNGANVTFNNVTFDYYPNVNYTGLQHSGKLVYNNCTINGQAFLYGESETFNNCTFNQNSSDAYNVWTYGAKVVNFNECTFNSAGKSVLVYNEGACATDLTVTDSTFNASALVAGKAAIEIDTTLMPDGTDIVITNSTATGFDAGSISGETLWNDKKDQTDLTVTVNGDKVWPKLPSADLTYGGYVGTSGEAGTEKYRENIQVDLYNVYAKTSLVVELYSGETLLSTTTLRESDRDDASVTLYPVEANSFTANIVVKGRLAGSWDTEWHVAPSVEYIPDNIKVYADGVLCDTWNSGFTNETEKAEYVALSGVYKAASVTDTEGNVSYYATLTDAIAAATAGATVTLFDDATISETITITADLTIDGSGHTLTYTGQNRAIDVPNNTGAAVNVTISDLTVDCTASYCQRGINYNDDGMLTLDNVTVKGTNLTYAVNLPGLSDNAYVYISDSDISGNIALNIWGENSKISVYNTALTSIDNTDVENYSAIVLNNDGTSAANGTTVTVVGGSITALDQNGDPSFAGTNNTITGELTVYPNTTVIGTYKSNVAIVDYGTDQFYGFRTLQAAIDRVIADGNGTVKLIRDITVEELVTVSGAVTINLNGLTIESEIQLTAVGATVTAPQGLKVTTNVDGYSVVYVNGAYTLVDNSILWGDVNGDGAIDGTDAMLLNRYTSGWGESDYAAIKLLAAGDINADGVIDGTDAMLLNRYTSGWGESDYAAATNLLISLKKIA